MLNYVILIIHSSHHYLMWDFTHMCIPNNLSFKYESLPLCGPWTSSPTRSPCLMDFFLHQRVIHGPLVRHPWEPCVNPTRRSMGTPHVHLHRNLVPHCYLAPLVTFICWAFSPRSLCVGRLGLLCPYWAGTMNTSPPSLHTTMGSDTICWRDKNLEKATWINNITYRDTLTPKT